jgi:lipoprotein-releasing system ATP-binding protein
MNDALARGADGAPGQAGLLEVRGVSKTYVTGPEVLRVLSDVNLDVARGEILAIVGPSGVGKSTLLHIMGALDRPNGGTVKVNGEEVFSLDDARLARFRNATFGFVFQFHHLLTEFTALENVMMPCLIAGMSESEAVKRAARVLGDEVGLRERFEHRPRELSGGEQQRVAVARALVMAPSVVFGDEPSGNLDPEHSESLHDLLFELRDTRRQSFVLVTHSTELARRADRVLKLFDGVVQEVRI